MKPLIVGLVNEKSWKPLDALEPYTPNGAGERLWQMLYDVTGATKEEYLDRFDRANVFESKTRSWRDVSSLVRTMMEDREVVVLGRHAWMLLGLNKCAWFDKTGKCWLIPHPSGRCRMYNTSSNRDRAGRILAEVGKWTTTI